MGIRPLLRAMRDGLREGAVRAGVGLARLLPPTLWLRIRERGVIRAPLDYPGGGLHLVAESWIEYRVRRLSCSKEPATIEWIEQYVRPGDVFYDIGANVGAYVLVAHRVARGDCRAYAFEPGFATFPQLVRNINLNGAALAIVPFQVALSDRTGLSPFHYQNLVPGGALHALGAPLDQHGAAFEPELTCPVLTYRLDDFIDQFGLDPPNHIKIDVDGPEVEVLRGAARTLSWSGLRTVLVETDSSHRDAAAIERELAAHGFECRFRRVENALFCRVDASGAQPPAGES